MTMHEKTLLYGALGLTVAAAGFGIYKAKAERPAIEIAPISLSDTSSRLASAEIPIRLTASDGTGLELVALRAEAAVEDPLALTELRLTFENPEDRVLEGTFRITLPQGASLSRFAMKVGDAWQEGEVVEKQAARQAYEDFLHRKQDPALMEQGAGNEFTARVFPIPARGKKELVITYAEALEVGAPYVLPLRGLPQLGSLDVNVHVKGSRASDSGGKTDAAFGIHQTQLTPTADFVIDGKQLPRSPGLRSGELAIARIVPFASSRPEPVGSALVLVDTSASRALGISETAKTVLATVANLPKGAAVTVACFDQEIVPIFEGTAGELGQKHVDAIVARGALGASDFEQAIAWAAATAGKTKASRVIFVTDGVATAGETDAQKLKTKVEALRAAGVTRMDAIATGGIRDDGFLRTIVRGVLDRDGVVLDAKLGAAALARRLGEATSSGVAVNVKGAKWSWPATLDGLQAGDEVLVYAELDGAAPLSIDVGGQPFAPDLRTIDRPLVERAWAQAKIQSMTEMPTDAPAVTKQRIVALSTRHRVLSPYTALLVLETDRDYQRFGIDRNAKVDILAVEDGRVAVTQGARGSEDERKREIAPPTSIGEAPKKGAATKTAAGGPAASAAPAAQADAPLPSPASPRSAPEEGRAAAPSPEPASTGTVEAARRQGAGEAPATEALSDAELEASSVGGLGLSGIGEGGGGRGDGVGGLGSIGRGSGGGAGNGYGNGARTARPSATARPRPADDRAPPPPPPAPPAAVRSRSEDNGQPVATVRPSALSIEGGISSEAAQRVIRASIPRFRSCYASELARNPSTGGRLTIRFVVAPSGAVKTADLIDKPGGEDFAKCVAASARALVFPEPGSSDARFTQSFDLVGGGGSEIATGSPAAKALPLEGRFKVVMEALQRGDKEVALDEANRWHADQPGDVLSLVALGEVFEARHDAKSAARAYGSILELFSFRADSRRFAGERLERLDDARALALAIDSYGKAVEQRPDHPASHRLYAFALLKHGEHEKAFEAMKKGASRSYPAGRFRGVDRILKEDLGLVAAAWTRAEPTRSTEIHGKLTAAGGTEEKAPSLRFVLNWETDANDVDFHIRDGKGGHAYYAQKELSSGGELYADVTTGYGPECFTIRGPREQRAYPYTLQAHYFSRGPMGYGMGKLEVVEHDGKGKLTFEERPFVVMIDRAYVDMGTVEKTPKLETASVK